MQLVPKHTVSRISPVDSSAPAAGGGVVFTKLTPCRNCGVIFDRKYATQEYCSRKCKQATANRKLRVAGSRLTRTELRAVRAYALDCPIKLLGDQLGCSSRTASCHVNRAYAKLRIHTKTQLIGWLLGMGLIAVSDLTSLVPEDTPQCL
jgi:DNA-binding CsgD family transcriptional regulator